MKNLILKVQDKTKVLRLKEFSQVIYVSKFMNTVGIEISEENIEKLQNDPNVIDYRYSEKGEYQNA